jgi:hypothetical protein
MRIQVRMSTLDRIGYGSVFNTLTRYDTIIKKESISAHGHRKIHNEIDFYEYVCKHSIPLQLPTMTSYSKENNYYCMTYMDGYVPLYTLFPSFTDEQKRGILEKIYGSLDAMHKATRFNVPKDVLMNALRYEFYDKLMERYTEVEPVLQQYWNIHRVNGLHIHRIHFLVPALYEKVIAYFDKQSKQSPEYCLIHGDCQFNNILIDPDTHNIVFIDPRASFGNVGMFGIKEYDYAKVKFALSGYDRFDNQLIEALHIEGDNLILEDISIYKEADGVKNTDAEEIIEILVALIWLGNAHCFKLQPLKAAYSYFYAVYIATKSLYKYTS